MVEKASLYDGIELSCSEYIAAKIPPSGEALIPAAALNSVTFGRGVNQESGSFSLLIQDAPFKPPAAPFNAKPDAIPARDSKVPSAAPSDWLAVPQLVE